MTLERVSRESLLVVWAFVTGCFAVVMWSEIRWGFSPSSYFSSEAFMANLPGVIVAGGFIGAVLLLGVRRKKLATVVPGKAGASVSEPINSRDQANKSVVAGETPATALILSLPPPPSSSNDLRRLPPIRDDSEWWTKKEIRVSS